MKKTIKRLAAFLISAGIVTLYCPTISMASSAVTIIMSESSITVGDTVTATVTINGGEPMYAAECNIIYNPDILRFESGDSAIGGSGSIHIIGTVQGTATQSYSLNFTAIAAGSCQMQVTDCVYVGDGEFSLQDTSLSLSVEEKTQSDDSTVPPSFAPIIGYSGETYIVLEYIYGFEYSQDGQRWQPSNLFSGLLPGTSYTFYQRIAASGSSAASPASEVAVIKTAGSRFDITLDNSFNIVDLVKLKRFLSDGNEYSLLADFNNDGVNDSGDLILISKELLIT